MTEAVVPDDVVQAAHLSTQSLRAVASGDWNLKAGDLDWDCRFVLEHALSCVSRYALYLAGRTSSRLPNPWASAGLEATALLAVAEPTAAVLAEVASAAPPTARGFHPAGMADAEGFVAMGCDEILIHTWDIAQTRGCAFDPPDDLCQRVLARLFPWAPEEVSGWKGLLWANDRISMIEHPRVGPSWVWQCAPLAEWNGTIPVWSS